MNPDCDVCTMQVDEKLTVLTTDYWRVVLAPDQGYLGRCYVTLRTHKEHLGQLTEQEWHDYATLVKRLEQACSEGFDATLFNWSCLMNNAYQKMPAIPHIHWHFRPRYNSQRTVKNTQFDDPEFGFHYNREHKKSVDTDLLATISNVIQQHL